MPEQLINTYTIMQRALALVGEPTARYSALKDAFLQHLNHGYVRCCDEYLKPSYTEQVTLDSGKAFDVADLTYMLKDDGVRKITKYEDGSADANYALQTGYVFEYVGETVVVPSADAGQSVWVRYWYRPDELTEATSAGDASPAAIPILLPAAYRDALKYFIAAIYFQTERNQPGRSQYWEQRFISAVKGLRPRDNVEDRRIRNKYPAQPF